MDRAAERVGHGPGQMALRRPQPPRSFPTCARADRADGLAMSNVTVIDTKRGIAPRPGTTDAAVAARLAQLQEKAAGRDAHGILELALTGEFAGKTAVVSSFGAESAVLLKLVADVDPQTPLPFLNTRKPFGGTLRHCGRPPGKLGPGRGPPPAAHPAGRIQ